MLFGDSTGLESAEATAEKIRYEMESSADEIINRLAEHIDRLEGLITQAEEVSAKLDGRLTRLRKEIHAAQESGILPVMTTEQLKSASSNTTGQQTTIYINADNAPVARPVCREHRRRHSERDGRKPHTGLPRTETTQPKPIGGNEGNHRGVSAHWKGDKHE